MGEGFKAVIFTGTFEGWVSARDSVSVIAGDPLKKLVLRGSCQIADGDLRSNSGGAGGGDRAGSVIHQYQ